MQVFLFWRDKMVKIIHYEVYTDRGDGWKLEDRFSSEQRHEAINLAKEREQEKIKVKIIREIFDVQDNSYQESVEYVSVLNKHPEKEASSPINNIYEIGAEEKAENATATGNGEMLIAILKLVVIIFLSLIFANIVVTLLLPIVEELAPEEYVQNILFGAFFIIFLGLAVPLLLNKVPWYIFRSAPTPAKPKVKESKFYDKANNLIKLYHMNEYEPSLAPAWPEAPIEYKHYIVDFIREVIANLDSKTMFEDSFSKLGIKLVAYGGSMELARFCGLKLTEANSLLYEAFKILDGDEVDLEAFYDSKKTFADNKVAIFLTGVGAHLMAQIIDGEPVDYNVLRLSFEKWEDLLKGNYQEQEEKKVLPKVDIKCPNLVNISCQFRFYDESNIDANALKATYTSDLQNIIYNLLSKYHSINTTEKEGFTSIEYDNTEIAVKFASEFLKDTSQYKEDLDDENLLFLSKCNIIDIPDDKTNLDDYIADILDHTYNNEILITEKIKNSMYTTKYDFEFLGEKKLNRTEKLVALYKLIYEGKS